MGIRSIIIIAVVGILSIILIAVVGILSIIIIAVVAILSIIIIAIVGILSIIFVTLFSRYRLVIIRKNSIPFSEVLQRIEQVCGYMARLNDFADDRKVTVQMAVRRGKIEKRKCLL